MNNKQNQKKYNQYKIMLKYILSNEIKEVVPTTSADTYHYKNMLKLYKDTKNKYKDECVIIYFIGINEKQEDILWEKKIINSDIAYQEKAKKIHNSSICILNNLIDNLNLFKDKSRKINEKIRFIDKQINVLLHNIENFDGEIMKKYKHLIIYKN